MALSYKNSSIGSIGLKASGIHLVNDLYELLTTSRAITPYCEVVNVCVAG